MSGFVTVPEPVQVPGLTHLHTGKVRDLYATASGDLVMVASDRVSAFDWVLPTEIPGVICVCPDELHEGFFAAKIRKG